MDIFLDECVFTIFYNPNYPITSNNDIEIYLNIYDIAFVEEKREKYSILSVPCIIINEDIVDFGKKDASEIVTLLEKAK